jgi:hypothetical protein
MSNEILHPKSWKTARGYGNGVETPGRMAVTGGLIGWNADQEFQTDVCTGHVAQVRPSRVDVRMKWHVTDKAEYLASRKVIGAAHKATMGLHCLAMAPAHAGAFVENRAKVKIEAVAAVPEGV